MILTAPSSRLAIIDMQVRLLRAVQHGDHVTNRCRILATGARRLGVPVVATEQNPGGIGGTVGPLAGLAEQTFDKATFDATHVPAFRTWAEGGGTVVLCGAEAHVCVLQTALGLRALGLPVAVVADGVGSRHAENKAAALERMRAHGVDVVTVEMALFEWMGRYDRPEFKDVLALIR